MTTAETHRSSGMTKDLIVFVCILALAGIQFLIAYQDISASQMFVRMLSVALIEAALALLFFMHLSENRGLIVVRRNFHRLCAPRHAIWMDRQLPPYGWRTMGEVIEAAIRVWRLQSI